jgi:hypothetical protein
VTPAGRHLQPDPGKGDPNTIGGYMAVHDRPAAFEGSDGMSYSVELAVDETGDDERPYAGYVLFLRWRRMGEQGVEGHLETPYLSHARSEADALADVGALSLGEVRQQLEALIASRADKPSRRWWDVMRDEDG